jgi:TonB-linked SusC/RagA family outer membrane protein
MLDPYTNNQDTIVFKDHTGEVAREAFNSNPLTQDHNIAFSGGNEKSKFASSLNYYNEEGLSKNTMYERFSGKLNSSYRLKDNFEILGGITYSNSSTNNFLFAENFLRARFMRPTFRPYDDEGNPNPGASRLYGNPDYYADKYFRPRSSTRLYLNSGVVWEIVPDLIFKLNGSIYNYESQSENFQKKLVTQTGSVNVTRPADASISKNHQLQHNVTIDYKKNINKHYGSFLVGGEYYYLESFDLSAGGNGAPTDDIYTLNAIVNRTSISSSKSSHRMLSGFSRLNYSYDDRFLFTAVLRSDGTSTLGDYKWGVFPGMSAGWNVHNESFYKETGVQKLITLLKPRLSYGVNGNISGISTYEVQGIYAVTTNYDNTASYLNTGLINRKLRWEKSKSLDVGLEMGLLDNRVTLNLNFFRRVNSDLLTNLSLPDYTGFSSIRTNLGNLENKGFEGEIQINILNSANGLRWDFGFNSAFVKNKILKLPYNGVENNRQGGQQIFDPKSNKLIWVGGYQEGHSIGDIVAYKCERILKDWDDVRENVPDRYDAVAQLYGPDKYATLSGKEKSGKFPIEPGDVLWKDFDKNDTIDSRDRYVVGNVYPKWTGGFTSTFTYKDFSLVARFDFALGHTIYNHFASMVMGNYVGSMNIIDWVYDSWSPENPDAKYPVYLNADLPKLNYKRAGATADADSHNSLFYEKGDYLAVRELTLGYRLPKQLISKIGLASAQLNLTGKNLAYITKFSGWNPEQGGSDEGRYPLPITCLLGLQVSFF